MERYATERSGRAIIRFVPLEWEHPKDTEGKYLPLRRRRPEDVGETTGLMPDFSDVPDDQIGICVYTSFGNVPISPVYKDTREGRLELLKHCSRNETVWSTYRADGETWAGILFSNRAYSIDLKTRRVEFTGET